MTGDYDSVIGMNKAEPLQRFTRRISSGRFEPADGPATLCGVAVEIGGDGLALSIAAASIVAKVTRDRMMVALAQQFPGYGWETNMGYGTRAHAAGLAERGVTPHHRRSFEPVHKILWEAGTLSD